MMSNDQNESTQYPQDQYEYRANHKVSAFTRLLWYSAGADQQLLLRCPFSDQVKFQGLGGVVLATTLLALVSGSYAFFVVFGPKGPSAVQEPPVIHWSSIAIACFFGLLWSLVIFNIDRFIVSSSGKSDQGGKITFGDFASALPRIVMATIIGICLSAPLEVRILKTEIDTELANLQRKEVLRLNEVTLQRFTDRKSELEQREREVEDKIKKLDDLIESRRSEINAQRKSIEEEIAGRTGSGVAGVGPTVKRMQENLTIKELEAKEFSKRISEQKNRLKADKQRIHAEFDGIEGNIKDEQAINLQVAQKMDGLMKRIQISHEIGGKIPLMIMLLLLAIEICPIFFKMLMTKSTYDFLKENQDQLVLAKNGIQIRVPRIINGEIEQVAPLYHGPEQTLTLERNRLKAETEINLKAQQQHKSEIERSLALGINQPNSKENT